jgi:hypothetical protein
MCRPGEQADGLQMDQPNKPKAPVSRRLAMHKVWFQIVKENVATHTLD